MGDSSLKDSLPCIEASSFSSIVSLIEMKKGTSFYIIIGIIFYWNFWTRPLYFTKPIVLSMMLMIYMNFSRTKSRYFGFWARICRNFNTSSYVASSIKNYFRVHAM